MTSEPQPANEAVSAWEEPVVDAHFDDEDALIVDVAGYEGPLDLLLALARTQKVDLSKISVLALADQYLGFIGEAQKLRLELAADYLVMAAWLTYLKSRLLLPREAVKGEEATRRGAGAPPVVPPDAAGSHARSRGAADDAHAARPRRVSRAACRKAPRPSARPSSRRRSTTCCMPTPISAAAPSRSATSSRCVRSGRSRMRACAWNACSARRLGERMAGLRALHAGVRRRAREWQDRAGELVRRHAGDGARRPIELRQEGPFEPIYMRPRKSERRSPMRNGSELSSW